MIIYTNVYTYGERDNHIDSPLVDNLHDPLEKHMVERGQVKTAAEWQTFLKPSLFGPCFCMAKKGSESVRRNSTAEWRGREGADPVFYQQVKGSQGPPEATTTNPHPWGAERFAAE